MALQKDFDAEVAKLLAGMSVQQYPQMTDPLLAVLYARQEINKLFIAERTDRVNYPLLEASITPSTKLTLRFGTILAESTGRHYGSMNDNGRVFHVHIKPSSTDTQSHLPNVGDVTLNANTISPVYLHYDLQKMAVPRAAGAVTNSAIVHIPIGGLDGVEEAIALNLPVCRLRLNLSLTDDGHAILMSADLQWQTMSLAYGEAFMRHGTTVPAGKLGLNNVLPSGEVLSINKSIVPTALGADLHAFLVSNKSAEAEVLKGNMANVATRLRGIGHLAKPFINMAVMLEVHSYHVSARTSYADGSDAWLYSPPSLIAYMRAKMPSRYVDMFVALYNGGTTPSLAQLLSGFSGLPATGPQRMPLLNDTAPSMTTALDGITEAMPAGSAFRPSRVADQFVAELMSSPGEFAPLRRVLAKFGLTKVTFNRLRGNDTALDLANPFDIEPAAILKLFSNDMWYRVPENGMDLPQLALLPTAPVSPSSPNAGWVSLGGLFMKEMLDSTGKFAIRTARLDSWIGESDIVDVVICPTVSFSAMVVHHKNAAIGQSRIAKLVAQSLTVRPLPGVPSPVSLVIIAPAPHPVAHQHAILTADLLHKSAFNAHNPTMAGLVDKIWYDLMHKARTLRLLFESSGTDAYERYYVVLNNDTTKQEKQMPLVLVEGQRVAPSGSSRPVFVAVDGVSKTLTNKKFIVVPVASDDGSGNAVVLVQFADRLYGPLDVVNEFMTMFDPSSARYAELREHYRTAHATRLARANRRFAVRHKRNKSDSGSGSDSDSDGSSSSSSSSSDDEKHNSSAAAHSHVLHPIGFADMLFRRLWDAEHHVLDGMKHFVVSDFHDLDHHYHNTVLYSNSHYPEDASDQSRSYM